MRLVAQRRRNPHQRRQIRASRRAPAPRPPTDAARPRRVTRSRRWSSPRISYSCRGAPAGRAVHAPASPTAQALKRPDPPAYRYRAQCPAGAARSGGCRMPRPPQMREEAVLAKAQGHGVGRRADDRVRPSLVARRDDRKGRRRAMRGEQLRDLGGSDERNVAGHGQHAGTPLRGEEPRRRRNRAGVAVAGACFDNARAVARRQPAAPPRRPSRPPARRDPASRRAPPIHPRASPASAPAAARAAAPAPAVPSPDPTP